MYMYSYFNIIHTQQMEVVAADHDTEQVSTSGLAANEDAHIQGVTSAVSDETVLASDDSDFNDDCDPERMCTSSYVFDSHSYVSE